MGLLILFQVIFDLAFIATATLLLIERSKVKTAEDPKLSRGLQLLTSKIAILEDLMDRSEVMTKQMTQIIDNKQQDIQERIEEAEVHLHKMRKATEKTQQAVKSAQENIPGAAKFSQASQLIHQGLSLKEIEKTVDIPRGELELLMKVDRERQRQKKEAPPPQPEIETVREQFHIDEIEMAPKEPAQIVRPVVFKKIDKPLAQM
jgi:hypothetical protein